MNDERDDPARVMLADEETAERARLAVWANAVGRSFVWEGTPPRVVDEIVAGALDGYEHFRESVQYPRVFIARRIASGVNEYREDLGLEPIPGPVSAVPDLMDAARTERALALLAPAARRAVEILFSGEKKTYQDVARELGVTVRFARHLVRKAMEQLRTWMFPQE